MANPIKDSCEKCLKSSAMAYLALLEDLANHALCRERVFKDRADLLGESTEWLLSRYRFPKNVLLDMCRDLGPMLA